MYDAIVVGARCAGAATAMLLGRHGYRVLMVDRATFPSDTISGHFIMHPGVGKLAEWELLDAVLATGCPPITHWTTNFGDFDLAADVPAGDGLPACLGPRRIVLDEVMVEAAVKAGVEFREGVAVTGLLTDGDKVTGVSGQTTGGAAVAERASIVIGADGRRSRIAELTHAAAYLEQPTLTCWYYTYWSDFPHHGFEMHWRPGRVVFSFPTNDGLSLTAAAWPVGEFRRVRDDIEGAYLDTLRQMPSLAARLPDARRVERFYGMADLPNFFRKPYGPGWALVGDAGHHKDPTLARGISDAFCDAELLADAVDAGLSGRQPMMEALADYERQRNERAIPDNELNLKMAHLQGWDAPEVMGLRAALRNNPSDTGAFYATRALAAPPEAFFNPSNLQRVLRQAGQPQPALS